MLHDVIARTVYRLLNCRISGATEKTGEWYLPAIEQYTTWPCQEDDHGRQWWRRVSGLHSCALRLESQHTGDWERETVHTTASHREGRTEGWCLQPKHSGNLSAGSPLLHRAAGKGSLTCSTAKTRKTPERKLIKTRNKSETQTRQISSTNTNEKYHFSDPEEEGERTQATKNVFILHAK